MLGTLVLVVILIGVGLAVSAMIIPALILLVVYSLFHFCWLIIGAVSLARSPSCNSIAYEVWAMGVAGVILGFISICSSSSSRSMLNRK